MAAEDWPHVQLFDEIAQVEHLVRASVVRCLPDGLSYAQFEVLNVMCRRGDGQTPAQIADALNMTRSGFTNTLQQLERRKLVACEGDAADRRRKRMRLTAEGRATYLGVMAGVRPMIDKLRGAFGQEDFRAALPFLKSLRGWMVQHA